MQVIYLLPLLLLSSVHCLPAEYDAIGNLQPRLEQRANDLGVWGKASERDEDAQRGLGAVNYDLQDLTGVKFYEEEDEELARPVFDDGKTPRESKFARINVTPEGTYSETYGGFMNMSDGNITTHSPHVIMARSADGPCKFPTNLKESEVDCTTYPSKVVCIQTCMFGYTMEGNDGIRRRMECNKEENRWKPVAQFEHCKPFVDCGVTIGPGGSYKCRKNYMHKGSDCDIACSAYEDKEAVPAARYECDINGNWTPQLPFCAKGGSGLKLVPVPHGPKQLSSSTKL